jgi:hypothetical protein
MFYLSAVAEEERLPDLKRRFFALAQTGCHDAFVAAAVGGVFSGAENPAIALFPKAIATLLRTVAGMSLLRMPIHR